MYRLDWREAEQEMLFGLGEVTFAVEEDETLTIPISPHVTLLPESTGTYPSAETLSGEDEYLSEEEEKDLETAIAEIERGEAKTFDNIEDALKWLKE